MKSSRFNRISRIRRWWSNYLRSNPLSVKGPLPEPEVPMLTDVANEYEVITWQGQRINLHKTLEKPRFDKMNRDQKRTVKENWKRMERKGKVKFIEVNGRLICILNRDYDSRADRKAAQNIQ